MSWSVDGRYLASRNDNMPCVLWIWDTQSVGLRSVVVFLEQVRSFRWHPHVSSLAVATGNNRLYFWSPSSVFWADAPDGFEIQSLRWNVSGKMLILLARDKASLCYVDNVEEISPNSP